MHYINRLTQIGVFIIAWLAVLGHAQNTPNSHVRQSGSAFLSSDLLNLQNDEFTNPALLWVDRGEALWLNNCAQCHPKALALASAVVAYPVWRKPLDRANGKLVNLEDQIASCISRNTRTQPNIESNEVLSLSAYLSSLAKGLKVRVTQPSETFAKQEWQAFLDRGAYLYTTRIGRMNLSCTQCHDGKVGVALRAELISPGFLTEFPIYRQSWQTLGSTDRRLRACYSGVQASIPAQAHPDLRSLELFLKIRSEGMTWEGPSIRR